MKMKKLLIFLLVIIIFCSMGYLVMNVITTRQGTSLLIRMNTLEWRDEKKVDKLVVDFKPKYHRFLYASLKSQDYREQFHAAYILARNGKKDYITYLEGGLKSDDIQENSLATNLLWSLWFSGAGIDSREILYNCQGLMRQGKYDEAIGKLTKLTLRKPDFAEAYNQRALAYFLKGNIEQSNSTRREDYEKSINDCKIALELNPIHFGAQSGMGECYMKLGKYQEAQDALEVALKITPYAPGTKGLMEKTKAMLLRKNKQVA